MRILYRISEIESTPLPFFSVIFCIANPIRQKFYQFIGNLSSQTKNFLVDQININTILIYLYFHWRHYTTHLLLRALRLVGSFFDFRKILIISSWSVVSSNLIMVCCIFPYL